jgi:hypothetical protein
MVNELDVRGLILVEALEFFTSHHTHNGSFATRPLVPLGLEVAWASGFERIRKMAIL